MKIHSLSITNFRGYRDTVTIPFDNLTVFVGKNDVGKSTILEALYIFFHDGKGLIKIDKSDVNIQENRGENHDIAISVVFDELPDQVIIDATSITTLQAEHLLNEEGRLEIIKKFHNGATPKVFIKAQHPTNPNCADLLLKKNDPADAVIIGAGLPIT